MSAVRASAATATRLTKFPDKTTRDTARQWAFVKVCYSAPLGTSGIQLYIIRARSRSPQPEKYLEVDWCHGKDIFGDIFQILKNRLRRWFHLGDASYGDNHGRFIRLVSVAWNNEIESSEIIDFSLIRW